MRAAARSAIACASRSSNASTSRSRRSPIAPRRSTTSSWPRSFAKSWRRRWRWPRAGAGRHAEQRDMPLKIALLPGDGIGPEVTEEAVRILQERGRAFRHAVLVLDASDRRRRDRQRRRRPARAHARSVPRAPMRCCSARSAIRSSTAGCRRSVPKRRCWRCGRRSADLPTCARRSATRRSPSARRFNPSACAAPTC